MRMQKLFRWGRNKKAYDFYLAGPMQGYENLNKSTFMTVARLLRQQYGYTVWNPSEHGSYLESSYAEVLARDLNAIINTCDRIALLNGWQDSLGANTEALAAFVCGKEAIQVVLDSDSTDWDIKVPRIIALVPVNLGNYSLPYKE